MPSGGAGGAVQPYGVVIRNAIKSAGTSVAELSLLREQVRTLVASQGHLAGALAELDREIAKRGSTPGPKLSAPKSFVVVSEVPLPEDAAQRIEKRLEATMLEELARVDARGDLVATPLSEIDSWGGGLGDRIRGRWIAPRNL